MTQIEIADGVLRIEILGWDKLWAFKSRLNILVGNVTAVRRMDKPPKFGWRGFRCPGTSLPGVIVAGSYYSLNEKTWAFWDVHNMKQVVEIDLQNERYARLVLEVEDPDATIQMIQQAIDGSAIHLATDPG
jgi:hypothetical protein